MLIKKDNFQQLVVEAEAGVKEGFLTKTFGKRGALWFLVFAGTITPMNFGNVFWFGLVFFISGLFGIGDVPNGPEWMALYIFAALFGSLAFEEELKSIAKRAHDVE